MSKTLGDQIRAAIEASGLSRYSICKTAGIDQASFSRFMAGRVGLTLAHLDAVAEILDLHIVAGKPKSTLTGKANTIRKAGKT